MSRKKIRFLIATTLAGVLLILLIILCVLGFTSADGVRQSVVTGLNNIGLALIGGLCGSVCGFYFTDTEGKDKEKGGRT